MNAQNQSTGTETRRQSDTVLSVRGLRKTFDGLVALDGADIDINEGEVVTLVGPNGAGKSTLFNCVMGVLEPTAGQVTLRDTDITEMGTSDIVKSGLSRTFQIPRVFPDLTVEQNMMAHQPHTDEGMLSTLYQDTDEETAAFIMELLDLVDLVDMVDEPAGSLSTGQQKLLNIATTLLRDPEVILLDEPTAGVNPGLIDDITDMILDLNGRGRTFMVIEHDMDVVRKISEYTYVLANGTNLTDGKPDEALSDPRVLEAYFGE